MHFRRFGIESGLPQQFSLSTPKLNGPPNCTRQNGEHAGQSNSLAPGSNCQNLAEFFFQVEWKYNNFEEENAFENIFCNADIFFTEPQRVIWLMPGNTL